jgi:NAD(P)H dehydrogenase (quinone)
MPKLLVLFYSRTGNTATLADAVVEGARSVRFTEVDVRRIDDLAPSHVIDQVPGWSEARAALASRYATFEGVDRLEHYDAIVLGAPTRYGVMAAELKNVIDQTGPLWNRGALVDKVGSAFTSVATAHGGHETTLWSIMTTMANLGLILVPPGYSDAAMFSGGSPYGATAITGGGPPAGGDLAAARHQGKRVATVAAWVHHAKGHDAQAHGHAHSHSH